MNNGAAIPQAELVLVTASSDRSLDAQATGGSAGLIVAGAAVAIADARGATLASIGSGAKIGQTGTVGSVDVSANSVDSAMANASAVTAGVGAVAVNVADAEITPKIQASIGSSSKVLVGQNVAVSAGSVEASNANVSGVQGAGIAVGVSLANATLAPTVVAYIDSGAQVASTGGGISVSAVQQTMNGAQAGGTASASFGRYRPRVEHHGQMPRQKSRAISAAARPYRLPGTVSITASGTNIANADATTLSVGITLNVAAVLANATASGVDTAYLGNGAVVGNASNERRKPGRDKRPAWTSRLRL